MTRTAPCGNRAGMFLCTRPANHDGDHVAGVGPWAEGDRILARWRPGSAVARDDTAIDRDGSPLPIARGEVRGIVEQMINAGELLAAVFRAPNGDVGVQVFGPPSAELLDVLEAAARGYRAALEGQGGDAAPAQGRPA